MRWAQVGFAAVATICLVLWIVSMFCGVQVSAPPPRPDQQISVVAVSGRVRIIHEIGMWAEDGWRVSIARLDPFLEPHAQLIKLIMYGPNNRHLFPSNDSSWHRFDWRSLDFVDPVKGWMGSVTTLVFPLWLPAIVFGVWPAIAFGRWGRRRWFSSGCCRACGYDLRGSASPTRRHVRSAARRCAPSRWPIRSRRERAASR